MPVATHRIPARQWAIGGSEGGRFDPVGRTNDPWGCAWDDDGAYQGSTRAIGVHRQYGATNDGDDGGATTACGGVP